MNTLSIVNGFLNLELDALGNTFLVINFLKNLNFKKENNIFVNRKIDAKTIIRIQDFFQRRKIDLILADDCQNIIQDHDTSQQNFENLRQAAFEIKNLNDNKFEELQIPEFLEKNKLKPYQIKSVLHALKLNNSANFSVPGSGKTWMTYASYFKAKTDEKFPEVNKLLVVCPSAAFQVWEEEYNAITGKNSEDHIHRISFHDRDQQIVSMLADNFEILLINYEKLPDQRILSGIIQMMRNPKNKFYLVLDESHKIKSIDSNRGIAAKEISPYAKRRMILTGTPMPNFHKDLWNQFDFLFPNERILGSYDAYVRRLEQNPPIEQRNVLELLSPFFTRITKPQLLLPATNFNYLSCPMTKFQRDIYEVIAWHILQNFENKERFRAYSDFERNFMYLIMASTDPSLLTKDNQYSDQLIDLELVPIQDRIRRYGSGELSGKLNVLKTLMRPIVAKKEKIVIWCNFRNTLVKVEHMLKSEFGVQSRRIDGSIDKDDIENKLENKEKSIREFKTGNDMNILIANPASLAEAVSLHKVCNQAIYVDRTYVATNWMQSKDRIHRIGSDSEVTYTVLMSTYGEGDRRRTVDDLIDDSLERKEAAMSDFLEDPLPNVRINELNYDAINDQNEGELDYRIGIDLLKENISNDQNN